jgi:hypothetical protein
MQFDFEDAFVEATGGTLVHIPPAPPITLAERVRRRLAVPASVSVPAIDAGLDVLFVCSMWPLQMPLDHVAHWRKRCRTVVVYLIDAWPVDRKSALLKGSYVERADLLAISYSESLEYFKALLDTDVMWLPQAINPRRFHDRPGPRGIFCSALGRQDESFFARALDYCRSRDLLLAHQPTAGGRPRRSWDLAYRVYSDLLRNSRYALGWSGRDSHAGWPTEFTIDPPTCRWYEASAAGCIQVGTPPESPDFPILFPEVEVVDVRRFGRDPAQVFDHLAANVRALDQMARRAAARVASRHTWFNRVFTLLSRVGLEEWFIPPATAVPLDLGMAAASVPIDVAR